jgi:peroxiredoxin
MRWSKSILSAALLLATGMAEGQYRNYTLPCLAPLVESANRDAPETLQDAFLTGPTHFATLLDGVGAEAVTFPISTQSKEAQELFHQGVALLHVLWYKEAERAFRTVVELDPECPMGYWGLAQASEQIPQRARIFAMAAKDRCDRSRPAIEQRWTALLANYYSETEESNLAERSSTRIRALEDLSLDFPDHREVRAFLIRRLTLDPFVAGLPQPPILGVDALAQEFANEFPEHPSRHYRVFLWLQRRPDRQLDNALEMTQLSPRVAEIWRYSAEAHLAAGQSAMAALLLEAALQKDHRDLLERKLMPSQARNLAANYEALVDLLAHAGRVDEALSWAKRALLLPRSPADDTPGAERLWVNALMNSGQWKRLLNDLETAPALRASSLPRDRAARLAWKGIAHLALGQTKEAGTAMEALDQLRNEADTDETFSRDKDSIAVSRRDFETIRMLVKPAAPEDPVPSLKELSLPSLAQAGLLEISGRPEEAFRILKADLSEHPYQWLTTAMFCRLAMQTGHPREALFPIDKRFRADASLADSHLTVFQEIATLAGKLQLPENWRLPPPQPELPDSGESAGPVSWQALKAPDFELEDRLGNTYSLHEFRGRPVLLNFFLGVQCAFCLEQFDTFEPFLPSFAKAGIEVLAVSIDSSGRLKDVLGTGAEMNPGYKTRFPFPVLADPDIDVFRAYRVFDDFEFGPMHATILIGPGGNILWQNIGHVPFREPAFLLHEAQRLLQIHNEPPLP